MAYTVSFIIHGSIVLEDDEASSETEARDVFKYIPLLDLFEVCEGKSIPEIIKIE